MARLLSALPWVAVLAGVTAAFLRRWVADDAYISFRYARNLVEGHGLVYNVGERVEGYTNFAWTLWTALGLALGVDAARWAVVSGLLVYAALIAGLVRLEWADAGARVVPVAALAVAADPLLWNFATSGLETMAFASLGLLCLLRGRARAASSVGSRLLTGALCGLLYLLRPEGALFAVVVVLGGLVTPGGGNARVRVLACAQLAAGALLVALPHVVFRLAYYGELLPNTYFAKSAGLAWYSQGLAYAGFYLQLAWPLLLGPVLMGAATLRGRRPAPYAWVVLGAAGVYAFYVVRVGGDFMLGRFLVPVSVLLAWTLEPAVRALWPGRAGVHLALSAALGVGLWATPSPDPQAMWRHGIADERTFPDPVRAQPGRAMTLRRYFDGLDVRVVFTGGDARLMYAARVPVAIEAEAGLTDRTIARQPLARRGRIGHEKHATLDYLRKRGAHFVLRTHALRILHVLGQLPLVEVRFDGVQAFCLRWDEPLMNALRARGARFREPPPALRGAASRAGR